jgi:hypothetical protein
MFDPRQKVPEFRDRIRRKHGVLIPGPQTQAMKLGFEKYFLWKMKHGQVRLP